MKKTAITLLLCAPVLVSGLYIMSAPPPTLGITACPTGRTCDIVPPPTVLGPGTAWAVAEQGKASWYGPDYHGRLTASGEIFNQNAHTLACNHLPFGTHVRVINRATGQTSFGVVNDRGPFVGGRKYDVSRQMAVELGMIQAGVADVDVEVLR